MSPLPNLHPSISAELPNARARYIMLGLGRESTAMLLMADRGLLGPKPDGAIVADTGDEKTSALETLAMLQSANFPLSIPIHVVKGGDLAEDFDAATSGRKSWFPNPPLYVENEDGSRGQLTRGCTRDYKIRYELGEMKRRLGYAKGARMPDHPIVEQWLGIAWNERHRMAPSPAPWIENRYPCVEAELTTWWLMAWVKREYDIDLESSGCKRCPFMSLRAQLAMKRRYPDDWEVRLVADRAARHGMPNVARPAFLSDRLIPLDEMDLEVEIEKREGTLLSHIAGDQCPEGACGV
ncbi:hypothetical protein [Sphingomonas sp.]|uniref:hypothetical protein n=1 Tax=Sphingomonas sp. TaxID=28214 RepID=UPI003B008EAB